jgi:nitrogen fixation protein FixH
VKRVLIVVIALLLVAGAAYANHFNVVKKAGDVTVKVVIDNDPIKVGNNNVAIELLDEKGKSITNADVAIYYFMPSMPAMNYEVQATPDGSTYAAVIKPVMPGAWDADIKVKRDGGDVQKATVSFDAK